MGDHRDDWLGGSARHGAFGHKQEGQSRHGCEVQKMVMDARQASQVFLHNAVPKRRQQFLDHDAGRRHEVNYSAQVDGATLALVKAHLIKCPTYIKAAILRYSAGRAGFCRCSAFSSWRSRCCSPASAGEIQSAGMDAQQTSKLHKVERVGSKVFGTIIALGLFALSVLLCFSRWRIRLSPNPFPVWRLKQ